MYSLVVQGTPSDRKGFKYKVLNGEKLPEDNNNLAPSYLDKYDPNNMKNGIGFSITKVSINTKTYIVLTQYKAITPQELDKDRGAFIAVSIVTSDKISTNDAIEYFKILSEVHSDLLRYIDSNTNAFIKSFLLQDYNYEIKKSSFNIKLADILCQSYDIENFKHFIAVLKDDKLIMSDMNYELVYFQDSKKLQEELIKKENKLKDTQSVIEQYKKQDELNQTKSNKQESENKKLNSSLAEKNTELMQKNITINNCMNQLNKNDKVINNLNDDLTKSKNEIERLKNSSNYKAFELLTQNNSNNMEKLRTDFSNYIRELRTDFTNYTNQSNNNIRKLEQKVDNFQNSIAYKDGKINELEQEIKKLKDDILKEEIKNSNLPSSTYPNPHGNSNTKYVDSNNDPKKKGEKHPETLVDKGDSIKPNKLLDKCIGSMTLCIIGVVVLGISFIWIVASSLGLNKKEPVKQDIVVQSPAFTTNNGGFNQEPQRVITLPQNPSIDTLPAEISCLSGKSCYDLGVKNINIPELSMEYFKKACREHDYPKGCDRCKKLCDENNDSMNKDTCKNQCDR